jgi:GTP-binding protein YchF
MKAGLVGFSLTGKTALFNAITGLSAATGAGGAKGKTNLGAVKVPDERIDRLSAIYKPKKTTHAELVLVDVPGPAAKAGGLDAATTSALREVDALVLVLRAFESPSHEKAPDAVRELADFEAELILGDLAIIEKRIERMKKEKGNPLEIDLLTRCEQLLSAEKPLRDMPITDAEEKVLSKYAFLAQRPLLVAVNVGESEVGKDLPGPLKDALQSRKLETLPVCATLEAEVAALAPEERGPFLADLGIKEPASSRVIRSAYKALDYISFFTTGEDEVKAWTVRRGAKAPKAAGRVHSDIERGFIRAEVTAYEDFIAAGGSEAKVREAGKFRLEGKDYVVADGDIVHFRFNV